MCKKIHIIKMKLQPFYNLQYKNLISLSQDIWNYPIDKAL